MSQRNSSRHEEKDLIPTNKPSKVPESYFLSDDTEDNQALAKMLQEESKNSSINLAEKIFRGDYLHKGSANICHLQDFSWEYTIVLKNPDYKTQEDEENKSITEVYATKQFNNCFKAKRTGNMHHDRLTFKNELNAFLNVFNSLPSFEDGKKYKFGGRMKIDNGRNLDKGGSSQDFLTLIRNTIFYKFVGGLGLKAKQILSQTGEFIYIVVTADESDLEIEAERIRYSTELEIALTDLQSLIPCDNSLRPFHLLKSPDQEIKSLYREIKPFLYKAFKQEKNTNKIDYRFDPTGVTDGQWRTYKIYLCLLKDGIKKIESSIQTHKNQMFLFQKLLRESLDKANNEQPSTDKIKNLWDQLGLEKPISAYAEYRKGNADDELRQAWKAHEIDETGKRSVFSSMERLRLLHSYISTQVNLNALEDAGLIVAYFPLHNDWMLKGKENCAPVAPDTEERLLRNILVDFKSSPMSKDTPLVQSWTTSLINQKIPLNKIRGYFGEKIALYFEFLRFYQVALIIPSIIGFVVFIVQRTLPAQDTTLLALNVIYSIIMSIWATVFLEMWKRREASLSIIWGQTKFEQIEVPRPQYRGTLRRSPITDEMDEVFFEGSKRFKYFLLACSITSLIILMVIGIVAGLLIFKFIYSGKYVANGLDMTLPVCSVLNAIQIQCFNFLYSKLVKRLTDLENHKTQIQYEDSYILKTFAFQFVNSFNSLCYIAFIKSYFEGCIVTDKDGNKDSVKGASCMDELYTQLISIFLISYAKNLIELGIPYIKYYLRKRKKSQSKGKVTNEPSVAAPKDLRSKIESQLYLETYLTPEKDGTIDDYLELAVQFGYLTLFALAFPLSTLLAFLGLWLEMYTDKLKILKLVRRPVPLAIKDIGTWFYIFSTICVFAIFSNTGLFCFTSRTFQNWIGNSDYDYLIFAIVVVVLLIFRSQLQSWIPDVEEKYEIVKARHEYVLERLLRGSKRDEVTEDSETFDGAIYYAEQDIKILSQDLV